MSQSNQDSNDHLDLVKQGLKYVGVGCSSAAIELAVFQLLLLFSPFEIIGSNVVALVCSMTFNFLMNRLFTFKSSCNLLRSLIPYLILFAFNTTITTAALTYLVDHEGWNSVISKLLTMVCVTAWNFVLYRKVIFR